MAVQISDLITDALRELGVLNAADAASGEDAALGLFRLNKILDSLNAESGKVYAETLAEFTLTPNLSPHTLGPSGTWNMTQAPQAIVKANLILSGRIRVPLALRDRDWWTALGAPEVKTTIPENLYYEPTWPNGRLYFWAVPTQANNVELLQSILLAQVAIGDVFTMPPGYQEMLTLTLAEDLAAPFKVQIAPQTALNAQKARARVLGNNDRTPRISTRDSGMPGAASPSTFSYLTRR